MVLSAAVKPILYTQDEVLTVCQCCFHCCAKKKLPRKKTAFSEWFTNTYSWRALPFRYFITRIHSMVKTWEQQPSTICAIPISQKFTWVALDLVYFGVCMCSLCHWKQWMSKTTLALNLQSSPGQGLWSSIIRLPTISWRLAFEWHLPCLAAGYMCLDVMAPHHLQWNKTRHTQFFNLQPIQASQRASDLGQSESASCFLPQMELVICWGSRRH